MRYKKIISTLRIKVNDNLTSLAYFMELVSMTLNLWTRRR